MSVDVDLFFGAVNIGCAHPVTLAEFWGKALGRPAVPGITPGAMAVGTTDLNSRPQMVFVPASDADRAIGGFAPTLVAGHHDKEAERLAGLGAKTLNEVNHPRFQLTEFADPEGNHFNLVTLQPE